jgi:UDP-3-O-[3-hydroxymyristoyl] glucosamine N-acyltransferase
MSEPVFFKRGPGFTVAELAGLTGAKVVGSLTGERRLTDIAPIERAGPSDISVAEGAAGKEALRLTRAGVCFVSQELAGAAPSSTFPLVVTEPYQAFVRVAAALYPDAQRPSSLFEVRGTAPGAFVHPTARIEVGVTIDPAAMVGPRAEIGAGTHVGPMAVVGPEVRIGRDCSVGAGASLTNALVGDGVVIEAGCHIGLARESKQPLPKSGLWLGRAILQDKVVVGANSVVDRGNQRDTIVGEGTMIDALVQVPADTVIGRYCRISAGDGPDPSVDLDPDIDGLHLFASHIARSEFRGGRVGK